MGHSSHLPGSNINLPIYGQLCCDVRFVRDRLKFNDKDRMQLAAFHVLFQEIQMEHDTKLHKTDLNRQY